MVEKERVVVVVMMCAGYVFMFREALALVVAGIGRWVRIQRAGEGMHPRSVADCWDQHSGEQRPGF